MNRGHGAILSALFLVCSVYVLGESATSPENPKEVANVGGRSISAADLDQALQSQIWQLRIQEYELRSKTLEFLVNQKLLDIEAARLGRPADTLLQDQVDSKIREPENGEVEAYYLGQRSSINRPFEEVQLQLRNALKQARIHEARQKYLKSLRDQTTVRVLLRRPKMDVDTKRLRGNPNAPVTIIEFSDLQCPYCRVIQPTLKQLLSKYGDRVNLAFRDMPLDQLHPLARKAAEATRCAAEQGKYWEYHDLLFSSGKLADKELAEQARSIGLDGSAFDACVAGGKFKQQIENDLQMGLKAGITGTPAFVINGTLITGSQPIEAFEKIIEAELAAAR